VWVTQCLIANWSLSKSSSTLGGQDRRERAGKGLIQSAHGSLGQSGPAHAVIPELVCH
jgi:hypothetical protein